MFELSKYMKNNDLKLQVKSARKSAAGEIELTLNKTLKSVAAKLGQNSKRFYKELEKGSKRLAKKLAKELEIERLAITENGISTKADTEVKKPQTSPKAEKTQVPVAAEVAPEVKKNHSKSKTLPKKSENDSKTI